MSLLLLHPQSPHIGLLYLVNLKYFPLLILIKLKSPEKHISLLLLLPQFLLLLILALHHLAPLFPPPLFSL